jgi:hypothetical protein
MLRLTVRRPVSLGISTHLGLATRFLLLCGSYGFVDVGRCLCREDWSVVHNCYWLSSAQSFSGPSALGLATIFYCLKFETSLFVISYDSQGYGGGIRRRFICLSQSHIATDGQSVCKSWYRAPSGALDQIFISV